MDSGFPTLIRTYRSKFAHKKSDIEREVELSIISGCYDGNICTHLIELKGTLEAMACLLLRWTF